MPESQQSLMRKIRVACNRVIVARSSAKPSKTHESEPKATPVRKHWIDFFSVITQVGIAGIALFWTIHSKQMDNYYQTFKQEQQMKDSEVQKNITVAKALIRLSPMLSCNDFQKLRLFHNIFSEYPNAQLYIVQFADQCNLSPTERDETTKLRSKTAINDSIIYFLKSLENARQFRNIHNNKRAADEYFSAYNSLPDPKIYQTSNLVDHKTALAACNALQNKDYDLASDLFEKSFTKIGPQ